MPIDEPDPQPRTATQRLTLNDWLSRDTRLSARPEMRGAFIRHCRRERLLVASASAFERALNALERGS